MFRAPYRVLLFAALLLNVGLWGCASSAPSSRALVTVLRGQPSVVNQAIAQGELNPSLAYLHVTVEGRPPALMVLGYADPSPSGTVLSWYSANGEVLQTIDGHVHALHGVPGGVSSVRYAPLALPPWPHAGEIVTLQRTWDVPSQRRYGLQESVQIRAVSPDEVPPKIVRHLSQQLRALGTSQWHWFTHTGASGRVAWFARSAVQGTWQVVYSYQCLEAAFCLHMAPWPVAGGTNQ